MVNLHSHKSYEIHWRNIIIFAFTILSVISSARIAYTTFEPMVIPIALEFHNEHSTGNIPTHKIVLIFLAEIDQLSLMLCGKIFDIDDLSVIREKHIDNRHYNIFILSISEQSLKSSICQNIHIPLDYPSVFFSCFHHTNCVLSSTTQIFEEERKPMIKKKKNFFYHPVIRHK